MEGDRHPFDPARGELWWAGKAAESVLIELHARRRALAAEVSGLEGALAAATESAAGVFAEERAARERVTKARASVALMPPTVEPEQADLLERLAGAAEQACGTLAAALEAASRFEPALQARVDAGVEYFFLHTMTPDPKQLHDWVEYIIPNVQFPATAGPVRRPPQPWRRTVAAVG